MTTNEAATRAASRAIRRRATGSGRGKAHGSATGIDGAVLKRVNAIGGERDAERGQAHSRKSAMAAGMAVSAQSVTATRSSPSMRHTLRWTAPSPSPPEPPG